LTECLGRGDPDDEVFIAWQCYQQVRAAYAAAKPADGKQVGEKIVTSFPSYPIREIARLGRTLRRWKEQYLGYFTTGGANNGGTDSTASSNSTDASPAATATPTTIGYACSSPLADSYPPDVR
jgi:hypothetical protein